MFKNLFKRKSGDDIMYKNIQKSEKAEEKERKKILKQGEKLILKTLFHEDYRNCNYYIAKSNDTFTRAMSRDEVLSRLQEHNVENYLIPELANAVVITGMFGYIIRKGLLDFECRATTLKAAEMKPEPLYCIPFENNEVSKIFSDIETLPLEEWIAREIAEEEEEKRREEEKQREYERWLIRKIMEHSGNQSSSVASVSPTASSSSSTSSTSSTSSIFGKSDMYTQKSTSTWYLIRRSPCNICVKVEHYTNNKWAAQRDMMALYGLSSSDIITSSTGSTSPWPTLSCQSFDGTKSH